ncbi:hypothetical protein CRE_24377 [Caenorhabditis remanei]|uniref:Uncharacterized protein n=1 Tax=Caenorhabditis remanei TaxID=31234 RepID=E3NWL3_CAERE|nr:hypothetical protein CRE_24377 [Caenorhabditis remanei]
MAPLLRNSISVLVYANTAVDVFSGGNCSFIINLCETSIFHAKKRD